MNVPRTVLEYLPVDAYSSLFVHMNSMIHDHMSQRSYLFFIYFKLFVYPLLIANSKNYSYFVSLNFLC